MNKRFFLSVLLFIVLSAKVFSIDFWRYNELADRVSIFAGGYAATIAFRISDPRDYRFFILMPEVFISYVLPIGLPFSLGFSVRPLDEESFTFAFRPAYHINFNIPNLDVYLMFKIETRFTEENITLRYSGAIGARYRFGRFPLIPTLETGYRFRTLKIGFSLRLN